VRSGHAATLAIALGAMAVLSGCGDDGSSAAGTASDRPLSQRASSMAQAGTNCGRELHPLLSAMDRLRGSLAAGLSYEQYLGDVRSARARHSRIDVEALELGCLALVGAPAERTLNRYVEAVNTWGDCLAQPECESASVEPRLQRTWQSASDSLSAAQSGLHRLGG
jgi:hypothetical protein